MLCRCGPNAVVWVTMQLLYARDKSTMIISSTKLVTTVYLWVRPVACNSKTDQLRGAYSTLPVQIDVPNNKRKIDLVAAAHQPLCR